MKLIGYPVVFLLWTGLVTCSQNHTPHFQPTFESLDTVDPVPEWFKDAKFGIYFHWGVYAVPAFANEWYPRNMYIQGSNEYRHHVQIYGEPSVWPYPNFITGADDKQGHHVQFAPRLASEGGRFDPEEWAQLFADAGARFAGPVAEHHDGFSMWASEANPWNAKDKGPRLDLVGLLTDAIRKKDLKIILSMHHAYNITGYYDAVPQTGDPELQILYGQQGKEKNEALWLNKHKEIIDGYRPDIIWQDFNLNRISQPVLLQFLSYYYNRAAEWNKEVVATYKDGLNTRCAVLDYERGGPVDITENYWLTDDAVSSTSWCYTEGISYYSKKQVLHGFLDRISKNGNLLLNISPMPDGTIPREQKEILLAMGSWLKKYGEAVYATRAWEQYGEGPTKMGASHGVFTAPSEGTSRDIRYTRSKDGSALYALLLGWDKDQEEVLLSALSPDRIHLESLASVALINGEAGKYLPLPFTQKEEGLRVTLPEKTLDELAYVLKLTFENRIPGLDRFVKIDTGRVYHLIAGNHMNNPALGIHLTLNGDKKDPSNQWRFESKGKGLYIIRSRACPDSVLSLSAQGDPAREPVISGFTGDADQIWKMEGSFEGLYTLSAMSFPGHFLGVRGGIREGNKAEISPGSDPPFGWRFMEVCDTRQEAFVPHRIPGTVEAEDFDLGCPGDAFFDRDETNAGGKYRQNQPVDLDTCSAGSYLIGWTQAGEWLAYTVTVEKPATYEVSFFLATLYDTAALHLEGEGSVQTDTVTVPNTGGFQNWTRVKTTIRLSQGTHVLKLRIDNGGLNIDKMVFEEMKPVI